MLTTFLLLPLAGVLMIAFLPRHREQDARAIAFVITLLAFAVSLVTFAMFDRGAEGYQFVDRFEWIRASEVGFGVQYIVGVDGLSLPMMVLTGLLSVAAVLVSFGVTLRPREYFIWLLVLETSVAGVFLSLDLIQFFLFWELELIPMYLLISIWGSGRKEYSAMKFLLYTIGGSALMLVGFLLLGLQAGTFDIEALTATPPTETLLPMAATFWFIIGAFLVKLPVFPVHTWLPDAHTDAPTAVSVMLAGVLLKMGGYGILRIVLPILPQQAQQFSMVLATIAGFSVVYGALITLRQRDLKRVVAYSSVSHMGYVLLGISALGTVGLTGAALQMFTHGTITGLLFIMVGLIYDRAHTRQIAELSGLMHRMPLIGTVLVIAGFAALGLPGLSGFVAELTVFLGALETHPVATAAAVFGVVLGAGYILWMVQRVLAGPPNERWAHLTDADKWWEHTAMAGMLVAIVVVGVYPSILTDVVNGGIEPIAAILGGGS